MQNIEILTLLLINNNKKKETKLSSLFQRKYFITLSYTNACIRIIKNNKNIDNFFSALEIQFIIDVFQSSFLIIIRLMTKLFYQG